MSPNAALLQKYERFILERDRELIEDRTADEEMQEAVYEALLQLVLIRHKSAPRTNEE